MRGHLLRNNCACLCMLAFLTLSSLNLTTFTHSSATHFLQPLLSHTAELMFLTDDNVLQQGNSSIIVAAVDWYCYMVA